MPVNELLRHMLGNLMRREKTEEEIVLAVLMARSVAAQWWIKESV
jgi:hypothetical protein